MTYQVHETFSPQLVVQRCRTFAHSFVIITDESVKKHYGQNLFEAFQQSQLKAQIITIPNGENSKSREMKSLIEDEMLKQQCGRDTCVIGIGGGVVTDMATFVAATYCRGVPLILVPTSTLAMVDASIGGKGGVNTPHGKNLIGAFHLPKITISFLKTLETLPEDEYLNGLVEAIKHALIHDEDFFLFLENNIQGILHRDPSCLKALITRASQIKIDVVEKDLYESGLRQVLNFGHTVGHAIEASSNFKIKHGFAVSMGIVIEMHIANKLTGFSPAFIDRTVDLFDALKIPHEIPSNLEAGKLIHFMRQDKKSQAGSLRIVCLERLGQVKSHAGNFCMQVPEPLMLEILNTQEKHTTMV